MIFNPFVMFPLLNNNINRNRRRSSHSNSSATTFREILLFNKRMYNEIMNASSKDELNEIKQEIKLTIEMFKTSNADEMDLKYLDDCVSELYNDIKNKSF